MSNVDKLITELVEDITRIKDGRNGELTWTLEPGRGATYATGNPTLYAHDVYPRSSVMSGRQRRKHVHEFDDWDEARQTVSQLRLGKSLSIIDNSTFLENELPETAPEWFDAGDCGEHWNENDY